ncbi:cupredoxin domain-containing protein [Amycolatopsis australiensis]|uniref:Plastocyanin n=1 Tax=Amycolatopsis australiensis TaxID=546364 RepID=A0A1K1SMK0_9PSEU|nr:cupredoxin family copper-binding protein [Amycolatopsis australiensis]SFW85522.1 Plastocyanin [Amycolatopsis australiensis]
MRRVAALAAAGLFVVLHAVLAAPPARAATQQVMMADYAFSPAALTVHVGDTVTWMQHDQAPHDATTTSAPVAFRSPQLSQGQSWSYTFRTPGTYAYYCSVHPDMRATVTVLPAETSAAQPKPTRAPATQSPPKQQQATAAAVPATVPAGVPAATTGPAQPAPASSAAAPASAAPETAAPAVAAATAPSLDPMLLVAGLVTGVAVLCLLLLGSRHAS